MIVDGAKVWALHATHGFPLEMSLPLLADRGMVPAWDRMVSAARADGADVGRLMRRLDEIVGDAWPPDVAHEIRLRLARMAH